MKVPPRGVGKKVIKLKNIKNVNNCTAPKTFQLSDLSENFNAERNRLKIEV